MEFVLAGLGRPAAAVLQRVGTWETMVHDILAEAPAAGGGEKAQEMASRPGEKTSMGDVERVLLASHAGHLGDKVLGEMAGALSRRVVRLQSGWLFVLHCIPIGILRRVVHPKGGSPPHTGGGAGVHADQDLDGDPLRQQRAYRILRWLLENKWLRVLNIWMPIGEMAARPLCVMDLQTLDMQDRVRHNWLAHDGWFFLHNPEQRWYWHSGLGQRWGDAVVFDTLRSPHSAFELPGEDFCYELRQEMVACIKDAPCGDERVARICKALERIRGQLRQSPAWPPPVLRALQRVEAELEVAAQLAQAVQATAAASATALRQATRGHERVACDAVQEALLRGVGNLQRHSVETRCVALGPVSPGCLFGFCSAIVCVVALCLGFFANPS